MKYIFNSNKERDDAIEAKRKIIVCVVRSYFSEQLPAGREFQYATALAELTKELQEIIAGEVETK